MIIKNIKKLVDSKPIVASLLLLVLWYGINTLLSVLEIAVPFFEETEIGKLCMIILSYYVVPFFLAALFGHLWVYRGGSFFKTINAGQYVLYYGIAIAYLFISKSLNMTFKSPLGIVSAIVYIIGIGFHEETIFRGLVANFIGKKYMKDLKGFYFSVAMTSVLFGLIHLVNMTRGVQLLSAVVQSLVAISLGAVFTAIYYRGGNLWALMFLHSVIDLGPLFQTLFTVNEGGAAGAINTLGIMNLIPIIPNVIALVWILRKSKAQEALVHMRKRYETL